MDERVEVVVGEEGVLKIEVSVEVVVEGGVDKVAFLFDESGGGVCGGGVEKVEEAGAEGALRGVDEEVEREVGLVGVGDAVLLV